MDDNFDDNQEWSPKYTPHEQECINIIESLPDAENEIESEKNLYDRKLWNYFQSCALAIAQLYKDNVNIHHNIWNSFQQASTNVACLYKECSEFQKKMYESNHQNGYHKRTKELLTWAKKKKSYIRRDELMAFLSGRSLTSNHNNFYHRYSRNSRPSRNSEDFQRFLNSSSPGTRSNSRLIFNDAITDGNNHVSNSFNNSLESDETNMHLDAFRQAISTRNSTNFLSTNRKNPRNNLDEIELTEFINQEYHRHVGSRKRGSTMDVCMDSPNHTKRSKFC